MNNFFFAHSTLKRVIFPVKMPPVHKVLNLSLGGQEVILTGVGMIRTLVSKE